MFIICITTEVEILFHIYEAFQCVSFVNCLINSFAHVYIRLFAIFLLKKLNINFCGLFKNIPRMIKLVSLKP